MLKQTFKKLIRENVANRCNKEKSGAPVAKLKNVKNESNHILILSALTLFLKAIPI